MYIECRNIYNIWSTLAHIGNSYILATSCQTPASSRHMYIGCQNICMIFVNTFKHRQFLHPTDIMPDPREFVTYVYRMSQYVWYLVNTHTHRQLVHPTDIMLDSREFVTHVYRMSEYIRYLVNICKQMQLLHPTDIMSEPCEFVTYVCIQDVRVYIN